ncbi:MAG: gluconate 2-dehydrogenase subunit 3 family protein [Pigmentiphaga sp.]|uniref:gluconate 2-dehydrogenase subunit 3 family protein n=1 Tax=Pigmentiphaga sp. TaxID=1977564 RepID=UPI0029BF77BB|nr:gluconate 2-dehydrogenase subunit 3 family protein [Pigmentiphaga sp.]MDX3905159.1 gluconate 2-dehydrogenase subunit 3 family protein [Pigmentiphaga sp.]
MDESRRTFLKAAGAAAVVSGSDVAAQARLAASQEPQHEGQHAEAGAGSADAPYQFFNAEEAAFMEAAVARLIPADDAGPGAIEAGVPGYIDRQLAGAWGAGERLYRSGPWQLGTPEQGYQLSFTPAELFRHGLKAVRTDLGRHYGSPDFGGLPAERQDAYLEELRTGKRDLDGMPSEIFFDSLWALTVEGFFCDPVYGGNKDMVSWKMVGFPGAYANYYHLVDQHGLAFDRPPMSLAQNSQGVIHLHAVPSGKDAAGATQKKGN